MSEDTAEVKLHFLDYWRVIRVRLGIIILTFLLVVLTAAITTYFTPKQYRSMVTMEVQPDAASLKIFDPSKNPEIAGDVRFVQTQFAIIQKTEILYPVIEKLKLQEKWAQGAQPLPLQYCFARLRGMMQLQETRGTNLFDIMVMSEDPAEAAELANTIAEVYMQKRIEDQESIYKKALGKIQEEVTKQQEKVDETYAEMVRIGKEEDIRDYGADSTTQISTPWESILTGMEQQYEQAKTEVATLKAKITEVEKLKGDELLKALTTLNIPDPNVQKILPQFLDIEATEANLLNSGLGQRHPEIVALRAQKAVYVKQLEESIQSIRSSLAINLNVAETQLAATKQKLDDYRAEQQNARGSRGGYAAAKAAYAQAQSILQGAQMRYQTQVMELAMPMNPAKIWQKAETSDVPAKPKVLLNMILGVLVGLISGIGLAFFIEYLDTSVKTLEDIENLLEVPVLAVIPQNVGVLHREPSDTPDSEAYRILRTNIEFNRKNADANSITFVSGGPGEGKSTTLCNLAFICAQGGYRVLIVDADLRRPVQHHLWDLQNSVGLTNYLTTEIPLADVIFQTKVDNLFVMPSGILPSDAVGILNSQRMSDLIMDLKSRFDIVFFDAPPILGVSDASVLASEVDLTVIVVQHRRFPRNMLIRVKQAVLNVGGHLLGVVLNNVDTKHDQGYEYYTSYYKYYYSGSAADQSVHKNKKGSAKSTKKAADTVASNQGNTDAY